MMRRNTQTDNKSEKDENSNSRCQQTAESRRGNSQFETDFRVRVLQIFESVFYRFLIESVFYRFSSRVESSPVRVLQHAVLNSFICPLSGKCLTSSVVYQAAVVRSDT